MQMEKENKQLEKQMEKEEVSNVKETMPATKKKYDHIIHYANTADVNMIDHRDDEDYISLESHQIKKQSMKGFNSEYNNIVDYIVKITRQIWKEKDIGLIYDTYSTSISVHKGLVNSHGINEVISGTLQTLQAFPDRKGLGWSVLWSGNDEDGFFTSHRGKSYATNAGDSAYGKATGKKVIFRTSADCLIKDNKIYEEWLVMDTYHLVQQLGIDPVEVAKKFAKSSVNLAPPIQFGLPETAEMGLPPKLLDIDLKNWEVGNFMLYMFNRIWDRRSINFVRECYEENAVVHYVCNKDVIGFNEIQGMYISLFASVPNAKLILERITCNKRDNDFNWDVAVRWRLQGVHEGLGYFGAPSGKFIEICGINHYKIRNKKIVEEHFLFDGIEVLRQIHTEVVNEDSGIIIEDGNFSGVS